MTDVQRKAEAERLFHAASMVDGSGREEEAIALYRRAALLGQVDAQNNLGVMLTKQAGPRWAEGMRWLKRAAYAGNALAAWNLAMDARQDGSRGAYLRWIRVSARLGRDEAVAVVAEIDRRRVRREPWFMLRAGFVDALDVEWALDDVRDGTFSPAEAANWAEGVIHRRDAVGLVPELRPRLLPILWEMTRSELTPQRASELMLKLAY